MRSKTTTTVPLRKACIYIMMWNMNVFFTFIWFQVYCDSWLQGKREKHDGKWEGATIVAGAQRWLWSGICICQSKQCAAGDTLNPLVESSMMNCAFRWKLAWMKPGWRVRRCLLQQTLILAPSLLGRLSELVKCFCLFFCLPRKCWSWNSS